MALILDKLHEYEKLSSQTDKVEESFTAIKGLMDKINEGSLTFFEDKSKFKLEIKLADFNPLKFDTVMYDKLILPFEITIYNNTFMETNVYRLVSRKLPNTITQSSNLTTPFSVKIGEQRAFLINIMIDDQDDVDWLIDNDLAFVLYSDNTTLSEIDFAIRMDDIRGVVGYSNFGDNTYDLEDQYTKGFSNLDEILLLPFKLGKSPNLYSLLKGYQDYNEHLDSTYNKGYLDAILRQIQEQDSLKDVKSVALSLPRDFLYNLINIKKIKSFRDKFKFNIFRTRYYDGIIDTRLNLSYDEAEEIFETQKDENSSLFQYNLEHTDQETQKDNLDMLSFMMRVPFFGSSFVYYDAVFHVLNIKDATSFITTENIGKFVGDFISVQGIMNNTPVIDNLGLQYDVSSQVKENLTTFQSIRATNYVEKLDSTSKMGYKLTGASVDVSFTEILNLSDITVSFYHHNPIKSSSKNWIVYEHSSEFRDKLISYDQYTYFAIDQTDDFPEDNSIILYSIDYTVEMWTLHGEDSTWTPDNTSQIISNNISISLSNKIKESFRVISTENVSNGGTSLLLSEPSKTVNIQIVDKITIFNDGNTFLNVSNISIFKPNGRYPFQHEYENCFQKDEVLKGGVIKDDCEFYDSFFDSTNPVAVVSFNTLTPGEFGYIYIITTVSRKLVDTYLSMFFSIPIFLRLEFNNNLSLYIKSSPNASSIVGFLTWKGYDAINRKDKQIRGLSQQHQYTQELIGWDVAPFYPKNPQENYFHNIYADGTFIQKSKFQRDLAVLSKATVKQNISPYKKVYIGKEGVTGDGGISTKGVFCTFSHAFIIPIPSSAETAGVSSIKDLIDLYQQTDVNDIKYRVYIMQFEYFMLSMAEDIKNSYNLVAFNCSGDSDTYYMRYNPKNEYEQYNSEFYPSTNNMNSINLSQVQKISAKLKVYIPESALNQFSFDIPKALTDTDTDPEVWGLMDMYLAGNTSMDDLDKFSKNVTIKSKNFKDKFMSSLDMGEIVGNKLLTMSIISDYYQQLNIKSYDNLEIKTMSIGPEIPDTYSLRIMNPTLESANMIIRFFNHDYTFDMTQEHKQEEDMLSNVGNYIVSPSYFDLGYIPIDETYVIMSTIKNQSPFTVKLGLILMDYETRNAIKLIEFPDNEDFNKLYNCFSQGKTYDLRANEEVKLFIRVIPRRIGMSFYTVYLKFNNTVRPISIEFKSFVNNKAHFVLDEDSKTVDFGDVPIGRYVEDAVKIKNIGSIMGKVNSIYLFGNDAKYFKLLDRDNGNEISERLSYNKVVRPKTSLAIPMRFYSQSYGFNYSYCYIETNEPVLEDAQYIENYQMVQEQKNAPKYVCSLLKANSYLEGEAIETDSYIFLGYVNPLKSAFRSFEIEVRNKSRSNIISIFRVSNLMKNYIKVKFSKESFTKNTSLQIQLNPRAYTEGQYYDELFIWMVVYDKIRKERKIILNKIPLSWYVTKEQRLAFDVDLEDILFVAKPFLKGTKRINIRNYSNDDCTMQTNLLTDHSGLFTIVPDLNNQDTLIPEGTNFTFLLTFGGDQRFIGKYQTSFTIQMTLGGEVITKIVPITGIVGDENYIKFYKRKQILVLD